MRKGRRWLPTERGRWDSGPKRASNLKKKFPELAHETSQILSPQNTWQTRFQSSLSTSICEFRVAASLLSLRTPQRPTFSVCELSWFDSRGKISDQHTVYGLGGTFQIRNTFFPHLPETWTKISSQFLKSLTKKNTPQGPMFHLYLIIWSEIRSSHMPNFGDQANPSAASPSVSSSSPPSCDFALDSPLSLRSESIATASPTRRPAEGTNEE